MATTVKPGRRLDECPEELVSNIIVKLDSDSSFAFRLTCRALEHKSLHEWASEYFHSKAIIPTSASLKVLASIAESAKLRGYVHHLYIIPAKFSSVSLNCGNGKNCTWKHTVRQEEAMHWYIEDQKTLKQDSKLRDLFTHVFKHLTSLHGISFTDSLSRIPAETNVHGHFSYTRKTNNVLTTLPHDPYDKEFYAWKSCVWKATVQAIADSGIGTLKVLSTGLDRVKNPLTLNNIKFTSRTLHRLSKSLRNIESLSLQITTHSNNNTQAVLDFDDAKAIKVMKDIASLMPNIESLDLSLDYSEDSATLSRSFLKNMAVSKLTKLRLDYASIDSKSLAKFTLGLVNVESLFLEWIVLTKGNWPTVLEALLKLEKLNHLHLHYLGVPDSPVCFLKELDRAEVASQHAQDVGGLLGTWPLADGGTGADTAAAGATQEQDDSDDHDSMPELEPQTGDAPSQPAVQSQQALSTTPTANAIHNQTSDHIHNSTNQQAVPDPESLEYRLGGSTERGRVICLNTSKEIQELLPRFIKEYHIFDEEEDLGNVVFGLPGPFPPILGPFPPVAIAVGAGAGGGIGVAAGAGVGHATGAGTVAGVPGAIPPALLSHYLTLLGPPPSMLNGNAGASATYGPPLPPSPFGAGVPHASAATDTGAASGDGEEE